MSFFIGDALAAVGNTGAPQADGTFSLIMIVAIFILFYFSDFILDHSDTNNIKFNSCSITCGLI